MVLLVFGLAESYVKLVFLLVLCLSVFLSISLSSNTRIPKDNIVNSFCHYLTGFCKEYLGLSILNGPQYLIFLGDYTCLSQRSCILVDYFGM